MEDRRAASDFMTPDPVVLTPEMAVHRAMRTLLENEISGAPVVDERGELVGILTERDCLEVVFRASYHKELGGSVADYMTREVQTIEAEMDIVEVVELFFKSPYRRFPVLSGHQLVGQISRRAILRAVEALW